MRMEAQKGQDSFKRTELQLDKTTVVDVLSSTGLSDSGYASSEELSEAKSFAVPALAGEGEDPRQELLNK